MDTKLTLVLSTLLFTSMLLSLPSRTMSDDACAYPCYPPPTGSGNPTVNTPPSQSGLYPPPGYNPTPLGNLPYYPPPSFGNNNNYGTPPPPEPILPYFPFYYRKPPHGDQSSAIRLPSSTSMSVTAKILAFAFLLCPLLL